MNGTQMLKQRIKESGLRKEAIMKALNIKSYSTIRTKINEPTRFTAWEITMLTSMLRLSLEDRDRIFFAEEVA